jgi:superfamily II DNA or RNA helicase
MPLPTLLKYAYNHGSEEVIRRGKKIFYTSGVQLLDADHLLEQVRFRVRNDLYQNHYTVTVNKFLHEKQLNIRCQCPYNLGEICRHEVAALFQLNDMLQTGYFENAGITYDQKHTVVRMRQISPQMLQIFTDPEALKKAEEWGQQRRAIITNNKNDKVEAEVPDGDVTYKVIIRQNEDRYLDTSCGCPESHYPVCVHKATVLLQVLKVYGPQFFRTSQDWDEQKNRLLQQYGYSLNDDLTNKFTFTYEQGKPFLRVLDPTIKKVSATASDDIVRQPETMVMEEDKRLGIVIEAGASWYPHVSLSLIAGQVNEEGDRFVSGIEKLELNQYIHAVQFRHEDRELLPIARKFSQSDIVKFLKKNLPFGDFLHDDDMLEEQPAPEVREQIWEYLLPKYHKLMERYADHPLCFIKWGTKPLAAADLDPVKFAYDHVTASLFVKREHEGYRVSLRWRINGDIVSYRDATTINAGLIFYDETVYCLQHLQEIAIVESLMPDGNVLVPGDKWGDYFQKVLLPWSQHTEVVFDDGIAEHLHHTTPVYKLLLQERDQMLVLQPIFAYNGVDTKWGDSDEVVLYGEGGIRIIHKNMEEEKKFIDLLRGLHTDMQVNNRERFFYLPQSAALANGWFHVFADKMQEWQVLLMGFEGLKNLRVSTYKPDTRINVSSGIDWFDTTVDIAFGGQTVTIEDVKRALAEKQNYVKLKDGSIGLLPEEWIKKYGLLLKIGDTKGNKVRLKKYHFTVLDTLLEEIDENALHKDLEEKKERLHSILNSSFDAIDPPASLLATLRPYQLAGFQWLAFLNEAGWGGILADDMGLGKTVQTLTFLLHYKNTHERPRFLVVCPTTLIYNWEHEIRKFTPTLSHIIHHGSKRIVSKSLFDQFDIVITTYGTMRSDIKALREISFDYVVLDESQSIKNPQSQVAKASLLLNCKNRLALSGTPLQNNTFDLYAQMNFLNPGMLGSREFFVEQFATPIDKFREEEVTRQLRKLLFPFLLRRTKEQVARDLPEKTETILYCEMGHEQRQIYDSYRNAYRSKILGMIDEQGIERSQMHILQGLTKLRQICDSPAILNEEQPFPNHSAKLDELSREIAENTGDHKVLIFSQFLGMLALLRQKLHSMGISYVYFDGSTSATERERAIQQFQNKEDCRVFLISLKAGGIGLNLTAADYVYIVDPWWNPAVEQQAIDRTHRIGQTKNIFAYRLICKDTLEEKMLQLQDRKRSLAADLVSDDNAFLKRLTRDDIAFLFS